MSKNTNEIYQNVTDQIIQELEKGALPWTAEWSSASGLPVNAITGRPYNGINVIILWLKANKRAYSSNRWCTFQQIKKAGGHVKKGEKSLPVIFYKMLEIDNAETQETDSIPMARLFRVFNLNQCEGLEVDGFDGNTIPTDAEIESFIKQTDVEFRRGSPAFIPSKDFITMPEINTFDSNDAYYSTMFHELIHWTGHTSRLDRKQSVNQKENDYAFEELVAEMGAAFLCARFNFTASLRHSGYISHWLENLGNDNRFVFRAAAQAQKAVDYLLADHQEQENNA